MTVHNTKYNMSYFTAPKCASTSLKTLFFFLENGFEWQPFARNGRPMDIHNVYPTQLFDVAKGDVPPNAWTFAVIRNPMQRLISCYKNRVRTGRGKKQLNNQRAKVQAMGLSVEPTFDEFVTSLDAYRELSGDIRWHSDPLVNFLGNDAGFFDRIYTLNELDQLYADLNAKCDAVPQLEHLQRRGKNVVVDLVADDMKNKIRAFYARDYDIFSDHLERAVA